jgi:hypothetical protein
MQNLSVSSKRWCVLGATHQTPRTTWQSSTPTSSCRSHVYISSLSWVSASRIKAQLASTSQGPGSEVFHAYIYMFTRCLNTNEGIDSESTHHHFLFTTYLNLHCYTMSNQVEPTWCWWHLVEQFTKLEMDKGGWSSCFWPLHTCVSSNLWQSYLPLPYQTSIGTGIRGSSP